MTAHIGDALVEQNLGPEERRRRSRCAVAGWLAALLAGSTPSAPAHANRVTAAAQIHFGVQDHAIPFSYRIDRRYVGYTVDICREVMAALESERGRPYANPPEDRWVSVTPQTRLVKLLAGDIDLECSSTSRTPAREKLGLVFSLPIFFSDIGVLLRSPDSGVPASAAEWLEKTQGRRVVTTEGSTSVRYLEQLNSGPAGVRFAVVYGRSHGESFQLLRDGEVDAFVMDRALLAARLATDDSLRKAGLVLPDWSLMAKEPEVYSLVMRADDSDLQRMVHRTLCNMARARDGGLSAVQQLHQRWFNQALPLPNGATSTRPLGVAMHPELLRRLTPADGACP